MLSRFKWWLIGLFDDQIEAIITDRVLKYHRRLVADGLIDDDRWRVQLPYGPDEPYVSLKNTAVGIIPGTVISIDHVAPELPHT